MAQDIFTVKVTDAAGAGATQVITVTVNGTNDAPVISGTATGAVEEDGTLTTDGTLTVSDADLGDSAAWSIVGDGTGNYGSLILDQGGRWSYALDNDAVQGPKVGDTGQQQTTPGSGTDDGDTPSGPADGDTDNGDESGVPPTTEPPTTAPFSWSRSAPERW